MQSVFETHRLLLTCSQPPYYASASDRCLYNRNHIAQFCFKDGIEIRRSSRHARKAVGIGEACKYANIAGILVSHTDSPVAIAVSLMSAENSGNQTDMICYDFALLCLSPAFVAGSDKCLLDCAPTI